MRVSEEVEIPAKAREPKPWYKYRPTPEQIAEMKEFIQRIKKPYLYPGHTHTKPQVGAEIRYVGEFELDKQNACPCPCCTPDHAKYFRRGMIAYFPEEKTIRFMGDKCFAKLNPEGHATAMADWEREERERKEEAFLLQNLHVVHQAIVALEYNLPAVKAVDTVRRILSERLDGIVGTKMWTNLRDENLRVEVHRTENFQDRDGKEGQRIVSDFEIYAPISGHKMLQPRSRNLSSILTKAKECLAGMNVPSSDKILTHLSRLDASSRKRLARELERSINESNEALAETEELRRFLSKETIATLNGWGQQRGCPAKISLKLDNLNLFVGESEHKTKRMPIPAEFDRVLKPLPALGEWERNLHERRKESAKEQIVDV